MDESSRPSFDEIFMDLATSIARRSTCSRLHVGCVITTTDWRQVLAIGYNGGASKQKHECESKEPGLCGHLHAEVNALINCRASRSMEKLIYTTDLPCVMCAKAIVNLGGVVQLTYGRDYRIRDGIDVLRSAEIEVVKYETKP